MISSILERNKNLILVIAVILVGCSCIFYVKNIKFGELAKVFEEISNSNGWETRYFYQPIPYYFIKFFINIISKNAFHFSIIFYILFSGAIYSLISKYIDNFKIKFIVFSYIVLNPYLLWSFYVSKDTAIDCFFFTIFIFLITQIKKNTSHVNILIGLKKRAKQISLNF